MPSKILMLQVLLHVLHDRCSEMNKVIADEADFIFHAFDQAINQQWLSKYALTVLL
jgi:hypothetical protein